MKHITELIQKQVVKKHSRGADVLFIFVDRGSHSGLDQSIALHQLVHRRFPGGTGRSLNSGGA